MARWTDFDGCTLFGEEVIESYVFGRLRAEDAEVFEQHLLICNDCRCALARLDRFIRALKGAFGMRASDSVWE